MNIGRPVDQELYADYIRQIRQCEYTDSINEFLFDLNTHCHGYDREAKRAVLARLMEERILTATGVRASHFSIDRSQLPMDTRDPYDTALEYLARGCKCHYLDHHGLLYRAEVYAQADREIVLRRLTDEGYLDSKGRILRRPTGSSIETYHYETQRSAASVLIERCDDGWSASIWCTLATKDSEGFGLSGPARSEAAEGAIAEQPDVFTERDSALRAAFAAVARQAERTAIEACLTPSWHPGGATEAQAIRRWAELTLGAPIPEQLPQSYTEERKAYLDSVKKTGPVAAQEPDAAQFALF